MQVSIIMGIYNCAKTLEEAIESILVQSYDDWELIMCDDGSTDDTFEVASKYMKKYSSRIVLIKNEQNIGLAATLNHCLKYAKGKYIARMDADDICKRDRLKKELEYLTKHPEYAIIGCAYEFFDSNGIWGKNVLVENPQIDDVILGRAFAHPTVIIDKDALLFVGGYSVQKETKRSEDYDLWCKLYYAGFRGYNLQTSYYLYREDQNSIRNRKMIYRWYTYLLGNYWSKRFGLSMVYRIRWIGVVLKGMMPSWVYRLSRRVKYSRYEEY